MIVFVALSCDVYEDPSTIIGVYDSLAKAKAASEAYLGEKYPITWSEWTGQNGSTFAYGQYDSDDMCWIEIEEHEIK